MITAEELYALELHEIRTPSSMIFIMRVPGGWIYSVGETAVFVPFNNEFQPSSR